MSLRDQIENTRVAFVLAELRRIVPPRKEGQSRDFAFHMDGYSLDDLNALINEALDHLERLTTKPNPKARADT